MNKILMVLLFCLPILVNAQKINKSDIIGTWTAIDGKITSTGLPADVKQMMTLMIDGFKESTWTFNENGTFRIKFKENLSPLMKEMKFLDNKLWKFNDSISQIRIGTKEDNYYHLVLTAKQANSGMIVYFSDTPIYLTLKKR
ncbi:hypothetical protein EFA69_10525 [Rufibacter immobilis]|uniref:DUF5004 domain-containing protein n=1 Tax=Rufibacter immobilis TaxID=1348778 RepID=A0A3M9MYI9_9BACT|nr:glycoside hydrolase family 43 C-terminal domain-containing protein [Rufibacter immobilis]RNI29953.1 hypothetical protein EFA69_10525 [Rufibacter immobilis]